MDEGRCELHSVYNMKYERMMAIVHGTNSHMHNVSDTEVQLPLFNQIKMAARVRRVGDGDRHTHTHTVYGKRRRKELVFRCIFYSQHEEKNKHTQ